MLGSEQSAPHTQGGCCRRGKPGWGARGLSPGAAGPLHAGGLKVGRGLGVGGTACAETLRPGRLEGSEPIRKDRANGAGSRGGGDRVQGWGARVSAEDRRGWGPSGRGELSSGTLSSNHTPGLPAVAGRGQTLRTGARPAWGKRFSGIRGQEVPSRGWGGALPLRTLWGQVGDCPRLVSGHPGSHTGSPLTCCGLGDTGARPQHPWLQQGVPAGISQTLLRVGADAGVGGSPVI